MTASVIPVRNSIHDRQEGPEKALLLCPEAGCHACPIDVSQVPDSLVMLSTNIRSDFLRRIHKVAGPVKAILISLLVLIGGTAEAASPHESYLAARDRYIQALDREPDDNSDNEDRSALNNLQKQLTGLIGPVELQGFSPKAKINLETLQNQQMGFGLLDALIYSSSDKKTQAIVTTQALLKAWIKDHQNWSNTEAIPQDLETALKSEIFYTQATSSDVAVAQYAEIPVSAPTKDGFAYAMLDIRRQDYSPGPPDEIIVTVLHRDRVFILSQPVEAKIQKIPACDTLWKQYAQRASRALKAYSTSKDEKLLNDSNKLEEEGDVAFRRCFGERFKEQASFEAVRKQAQTLIQRLPSL
jgi:hypothetical protein